MSKWDVRLLAWNSGLPSGGRCYTVQPQRVGVCTRAAAALPSFVRAHFSVRCPPPAATAPVQQKKKETQVNGSRLYTRWTSTWRSLEIRHLGKCIRSTVKLPTVWFPSRSRVHTKIRIYLKTKAFTLNKANV